MMHRRQILGIFLLGAAAVFGCRGASSAETQATIPPTNPPIPTATASPSVTPTPTNTPTATPTIAPSPTATPRPSPTPTPKGFYVNEEGAYSLIYPVGWEILEEEGSHVMLFHAQDLASFSAVSTISDGSITFDDVVLELVNQIGPGTVVETQDTFPMRDGTIAQRAVLGASIEELDTTIHVIWVEKGMRDYLFLAWAPDYEFSRRRRDVEKMLSSVRLESSWVYGNERESTLVLLGSDPFSGQLDPARMTGSADSYAGHLYSGLVRLAPDMRIEPDLAESWEISADGTVYSFTLRPDLAFQSGKPLTAADVKYSWERAANPETGSPTVKTYLGDIVGVLDKVEGRADEISGVRVLDERTLEVELDGPKPYFLAKLTYPTTFVLDQENVEADPDTWMFEPNASGPFILEEIREEEAIIFKPNESYYEPPALDAVIYLLYLGGDNVSFFEAGEIDITGVGDSDVKVLQDPDHPLHDQLLTATSMCTSFIALNNTRPPMDDPNVRRAFALAVDKEHLNEVFNENLDLLAASILPPAMPGFSPDLPQFSYDPEAARAALAESKYQDGLPTIVISASGYGELDDPVILALMDTWRTTLGVDFEVQMVDPENFIDLVWEAEEHLTVGGWCADYPDPENFLDNLFHSDSIFNLANYQNPDLDALLEAGRTESDPADRLAIYHQAETLVLEDGAAIPLWHSVFNVLVNPRVQGYTLPPIGAPILHLLSLETAEP